MRTTFDTDNNTQVYDKIWRDNKKGAATLFIKMNHNDDYTIRPTGSSDMDCIMAMYDHSRGLMRASGNTTQWTGYPSRTQLQEDMDRHVSWTITDGHQPVGTFALVPGIEPTYGMIVHGHWIDNTTPYATMHRLAKAIGASHIATAAFRYAKEHYDHLRIDTHTTNTALRHLADKEGFVECGTVFMNDGTERLAYEWWRWDNVDDTLKNYIEETVMPQYNHFDAAHRHDHARRVIARAMKLGEQLNVDANVVYAAAALHDIGLSEGREEHHLASGRKIRACRELHRWFDDDEVEKIAQAAEDHRASATRTPRSLLGCIVAEADRDVEPETIVRRTVEYGISHYPTLDREGHWRRTLEHLHEKYDDGGYIKLWLAESPNALPLAELRHLIHDETKLRLLFEDLFEQAQKAKD